MAWWTEQRLHPKAKSKFVVVFGSNFFIPSVKTISKPKVDFDTKEYKLLNHKFNYPGNATWQPIEMKFVDMNGLGDTNDTFDTSAFLWQILNNTGYAYPYLDDASNVSNNPYYNNVVNQKVGSNGGHHIATKLSYVQDDPNTKTNERLTSFRTITTPEKSSTIANSFGKGLDGNIDNQSAHYSRQKISIYQLSPEGDDSDGNGAKIVECWHLVNPIVKSIGWGDLSYDSDELVEYSLNIVYDWAIYDRKVIGTNFVPDAKPYRDFMKSYALAQSIIDQEQSRQIFEDSAIDDMIRGTDLRDYAGDDGVLSREEAEQARIDAENQITNLENNFDVNQDGEISEGERVFTEARIKEAEALLESAKIEIQKSIEADESAYQAEQQKQERIETALDALVASGEQAGLDQTYSDENFEEYEESFTQDFADDFKEQIDEMEEEERQKIMEEIDAESVQRYYDERVQELEDIVQNEQNERDRQQELIEYQQAEAEDNARFEQERLEREERESAAQQYMDNNPDNYGQSGERLTEQGAPFDQSNYVDRFGQDLSDAEGIEVSIQEQFERNQYERENDMENVRDAFPSGEVTDEELDQILNYPMPPEEDE